MECPIFWVHDGAPLDLYWNHELSFFNFSFTSALNCTRKSEFDQSDISIDHHWAMCCLVYLLASKSSDIFKNISTWYKENVHVIHYIWKYARKRFRQHLRNVFNSFN